MWVPTLAIGIGANSAIFSVIESGIASSAWIVRRTMSTMLYGVGATDLPTFAGVFGVLTALAAAACALPAVRAFRLDPMEVLRQD